MVTRASDQWQDHVVLNSFFSSHKFSFTAEESYLHEGLGCWKCFLHISHMWNLLKIHLSFPSHLHCLISFSTSNNCLSLCYLSEDSVFRYHLTATWNKIILYVLYCVQDVIRPNWPMNIRKFHWIVNHEGESNWVLFLPFLGGRIELQPKSVIFTTMRLSTTQFVDLSRPWTSVLLECR